MSEFPPVRLGVLGCGRIVTRRILPAVEFSQHVEVAAIASERSGVAKRLADESRIANSFESYDSLLACKEIDAVYIPCTGDAHCRWTVAAAEAGKHVLCEKPLAPTWDEAQQMVTACEQNGVLLQEAFMWRHHNRAIRIRQLVEEQAIGQLRMINVSFSFNIDRNDWRLRPERGGGAMWDLGCYGVNAARFFSNQEPEHVDAAAHWWPTGVDMSMRIGLTFPGDVLANIDCSFEAPFRCRLELVGDGGSIVVDPAFQPGDKPSFQLVRSADRDSPYETVECDSKDQYACQLDAFAQGIRQGRLVEGAENGLRNMAVMQQALETSKSRRHSRSLGGNTPIDPFQQ